MSFRILSLSGGGIRGIFQSVYLREIAKNLDQPLAEVFQLIAGTSTGALLALGLALKIEPQQLVDLFLANGSRIFGPKRLASLFRHGAKYSVEPLRGVLEEIYGDKRLGDCAVPVIVCSTVLNRYRHRVFTNIKRRDEKVGDSGLRVVDVALASCAAPTYFPSFHFGDGSEARTYVDGGLWANNPALVSVISAHRNFDVEFDDMRLVSLGNGRFPSGFQAKKYDSARPISMVADILELMFSCQHTAANDLAGSLIGDSNVLGLDTDLGKPIELDDVKTAIIELPPLAEGDARNAATELRNFLFGGQNRRLAKDDFKIGLHVVISGKPRPELEQDVGIVKWTAGMNEFRGRSAIVTEISQEGPLAVKLDVDSGKNWWAVEWLTRVS